jgi:uncharacterized membrane protein
MAEQRKMKTIWYLSGLTLVVIGLVVLVSGLYYLFYPGNHQTVLAHLYPNLWWGLIILLAGMIFLLTNRKATVE